MPLTPDYGETLLPDDELVYLRPDVRDALPEPITKADIYALEDAAQAEVVAQLLPEADRGDLTPESVLKVGFVQDLHRQLYAEIWTWGGELRRYNTNIGVDWYQIAVELRTALDDVLYRWNETDDWTARELGIAAHAATVRIHPFVDGNGRSTRLLAVLVFVAAQDGAMLEQYDWDLDKRQYIALLKAYDDHRDPRDLSNFISVNSTY
jgi:fido (protein-threonine AMPylation protein)